MTAAKYFKSLSIYISTENDMTGKSKTLGDVIHQLTKLFWFHDLSKFGGLNITFENSRIFNMLQKFTFHNAYQILKQFDG